MNKVLIIDDDPDVLKANRYILEQEGYEVVEAINKETGFSQLEKEQPDLIILDVMMEQEVDGIVFAQECRKKEVAIPIIMLTAVSHAMGYQYEPSEMIPVDSFISKPVEPKKLIEKVKALLDQGGNTHA